MPRAGQRGEEKVLQKAVGKEGLRQGRPSKRPELGEKGEEKGPEGLGELIKSLGDT